jgi:hypothetical protein
VTGVLHGKTVVLDEAVPPLDGLRVRVILQPVDDSDVDVSRPETERLWQEWMAHGPHGPVPVEDEEEP